MAKKPTNGNLALEQQRVIVIPAHDVECADIAAKYLVSVLLQNAANTKTGTCRIRNEG